MEQLITSFLTSLSDLKADPFKGGYLSTLPEMLSTQGISAPLGQESFKTQAQSYIARVIKNFQTRFTQVHLLTCLGYFDPCNVEKATPTVMLEVGEMLSIDGHKLWLEFTGYKSLVQTLPKERLEVAVKFLHSPSHKETMAVAYPLISDILARIAVLPASSAEVERVFSAM